MKKLALSIPAIAALACAAPSANAAFIFFNDAGSSENVIVSAGDFERGFSVNGSLITSGLGHHATVTEPESFTYSGSWIDEGRSTPGTFAQVAFDGKILSDENVYTVSTAGGFGTITGSFCSDPTVCTIPTGAKVTTVPEGASFSQPFLSARWVSDPEPASGLVVLAGLAGLCWVRSRRRKSG